MNRFQKLVGASALCWMGVFSATASATTKADYDAVRNRSAGDYKAALAKCDSLSGNPKDICKAEAKAARTKADAAAEADYKNTPKARADAISSAADADYDVAKQRCDAKTGNEKDVCVKEAKAAQVKAKADAKAGEKSSVARADAADDKRTANYKVAMEKCDGLAGAAKDNCQKDAKAAYGK